MSKANGESSSSNNSDNSGRSRTDLESHRTVRDLDGIGRSRAWNAGNGSDGTEPEQRKPWQTCANEERPCRGCGVPIEQKWPGRKFCSWSCFTATGQRGENNPNWRGGISKDHYRYKRRFAAKNPEKVRAHRLVAEAKARGDLIPQPCERCGSDRAHAHHEDYSKPLEVRWMCQRCHNQEHSGPRAPFSFTPKSRGGGFFWRGKWRVG